MGTSYLADDGTARECGAARASACADATAVAPGRQGAAELSTQWSQENAAAELPEHGLKQSWETCFSGLQKDLLQPLRRRLIKDGDHVTRQHWELLLDAYSDSISDILDALLEEALEQLPWAVYRVGPSDWRGISSSALSRGDAQPSSSRGARRSAKSESSRRGLVGGWGWVTGDWDGSAVVL
eukprot:g20441.t1